MAVDYMTFQEVLEELQIDEDELKRLVSNAELRGFRAGSSMKFKRDDVMNLKQGRETEPTIILTDSDQEMGIAESSDELILEDSTSDTVIHIGDIMGGARSGSQQEIIFDTTEEYTVSPHDSDLSDAWAVLQWQLVVADTFNESWQAQQSYYTREWEIKEELVDALYRNLSERNGRYRRAEEAQRTSLDDAERVRDDALRAADSALAQALAGS